MPRSLVWDSHENKALAKAYKFATGNGIQGADQTSETFFGRVYDRFQLYAPGLEML